MRTELTIKDEKAFEIVECVSRHEKTLVEVCSTFYYHRPWLTSKTKRLADSGWIKRGIEYVDRRPKVVVSITSKGETLLKLHKDWVYHKRMLNLLEEKFIHIKCPKTAIKN